MKGKKTGGRRKGTPNKATREIKAATSAFLSSPAYVASAKQRILKGEAPHLGRSGITTRSASPRKPWRWKENLGQCIPSRPASSRDVARRGSY
jgi:hypothetical protein